MAYAASALRLAWLTLRCAAHARHACLPCLSTVRNGSACVSAWLGGQVPTTSVPHSMRCVAYSFRLRLQCRTACGLLRVFSNPTLVNPTMKIFESKLVFTCVCEDAPDSKTDTPELAVRYMQGAFDAYPEQEQFWVILLNRKNVPKSRHLCTLGTQTAAMAHPREVFRAAVAGGAAGVICVHNHPSGDPSPSMADVQVTRQLREAARVLEIELVDHVIIGSATADPMGKGFYSFRQAGVI